MSRRRKAPGGDPARGPRVVRAAFEGRLDVADALLVEAPGLARESVHVAAVLADREVLAAHVEADPERANEPMAAAGVTPLLALVLSAYVRPGAPRAGHARAAADVLLAAGADPNDGIPRPGAAPLLPLPAAAGLVRDVELVNALLAAGADVEAGGALGTAVRTSELAIARVLLEAGADVDGNGGSPRDATALYTVLDTHYDAERLSWLLANGADASALRGPHGESAVHVAARRRRVEAVKLLAARGAALDRLNADGMRAFQHAARRGFSDVCDALRAAGASDELTVGDRFAARLVAGELEAARALAAEGAPLDVTRAAETRLLADLAGYEARRAEVEYLLGLGCPVDARGLDGGTALHQAGWFGAPGNVELLLARGAPLEVVCEMHDSTPLGWVAHGSRWSDGAGERQAEYVRCAEMLLAAGASLAHPAVPGDRSGGWLLECASGEVAGVLRGAGATG